MYELEAVIGLVALLLDGLKATGRWTLSLGGWKASSVEEAFLGFMVWVLAIVLLIGLFVKLV